MIRRPPRSTPLYSSAASDVYKRQTPVLVGGSGLYVRAVLDELRFPGTDPAVRARLEAELAAAILATNGRRIVRALEVVELSGGPFAARLPPYPDNVGSGYYDTVQLG